MCRQWRCQHPGLTLVFDCALYCRTRACLICMFVPPPTSLIWLLTLALSIGPGQCSYIFVSCWPSAFNLQVTWIKKISFVATVLSNAFARALLGPIHWSPSCPLQLSIFSNLIHIRLNVFLKQWVCIEHWIWIPIQWTVPIREYFKRTINCPVTRANMNEPKTQRLNWRYHCSVTCVT